MQLDPQAVSLYDRTHGHEIMHRSDMLRGESPAFTLPIVSVVFLLPKNGETALCARHADAKS